MALAPTLYDRVMETTATTGTGTLTLAGAVSGYQSFGVVGDGFECSFVTFAVDGSGVPTGDWETARGNYTLSGTTLARTTILASSNSNAAVSFAAGTKRVALTSPAQLQYAQFGGAIITPPATGIWSWVNQGSSTVTNRFNGITLQVPAAVSASVTNRDKALAFANTYTATACFIPTIQMGSAADFGLYLNNGTGLVGNTISLQGGLITAVAVHYTNTGSFSAFSGSAVPIYPGNPIWLQIVDDNTNRHHNVSTNGVDFFTYRSDTRTTFITPTRIGWGMDTDGAASNSYLTLLSFTETSP